MIEAVVKSSVILLMALGALPLLRRQSAALRHAVLTVGLVCALAIPVLSPLIPSWRPDEKFGVRPLVPLFADPEISDGKTGHEWSDTEFLPQSRRIPSTAA